MSVCVCGEESVAIVTNWERVGEDRKKKRARQRVADGDAPVRELQDVVGGAVEGECHPEGATDAAVLERQE